MAKMPQQVTVGRTTYRVVCDAAEWHELTQKIGINQNDHGGTNHHQLIMAVNPSDHAQQQADTLLHEIMHAIWFVGCLANALNSEGDKEEAVIGQLSPWMTLVLAQNPDVYSFIADPEA